MALDCYHLVDVRHQYLLFQIDEQELVEIEEILIEFKRLTGIYIDPYGTTRIHQEFIELLLSKINKSLDMVRDKNVSRVTLLDKLTGVKEGLFIVGD
ncbi:hypothetical protein [Mucilaginibacter sp.]|uniref:hypothetical protein n=1 Tax=Mucilaginibacter sp. TaxID=1882438 RepID=UPI0025D7FC46|nr:hypothetical protein [Mucilaginibacter sp.]